MSRTEQDFLGQREIADDIYYGVQTIRGRENFHITGIPMSQEPYFVKALGYVKKAAALANRDLGVLDRKVADAIAAACDRLIAADYFGPRRDHMCRACITRCPVQPYWVRSGPSPS